MRTLLLSVDHHLHVIESGAGDERAAAEATLRALLEQAHQLDELDPGPWRVRGQLARVLGDLAESERCFQRQAELDDRPEIAFDRALVAFTARDDARARTLATAATVDPELGGAQLLDAYLARDPARLRALLAIIEVHRRKRVREHTSSRWSYLEPAAKDLVRTGRHAEIIEWLLEQLPDLASGDTALRAPAAACLLGWAEGRRQHIWRDRGRAEDTQLAGKLYAAAAALDPLGGSVHYHWSWFIDSEGHDRIAAKLEDGLEVAPDHIWMLHRLGYVVREAHDYDRAIALLERCVTVSRGDRRPEDVGPHWGLLLEELSFTYYEKACFALHVARGERRPPSRPTDDALDCADAALRPALESENLSSSAVLDDVLQCKSLIEEYRGNFDEALVWANRALEVNGRSSYLWSTVGHCLNNLGRLDEAIEHCERGLAFARNEDHWYAHLVIACVLAKQNGPRDDIYARLRRVIELRPEARAELAIEPDLASLRDEPAFVELVRDQTGIR